MTKFQDVEAPYTTYSEEAAPVTPAAGRGKTYYGTDKALHVVDDTGADTALGAGGGGGAVATDAIFDAKGDLPVGTGADTAAKLTVGANGTVLTADSGEATGLKWATPTVYQAADADLTTIAGLTATSDNFMQAKAGAWASRTIAQVKTDLSLAGSNTGDEGSAAALAAHEADTTSIHGITDTANLLVSGGALGTPSSATLTNATGLPTAGLVNDAVTYAKMQNVSATDKVLGRSTAGAGDVEEIAATSFGRGVLAAASNAAIVDLIGGAASVGTGGLVRASAAGGADVVISPTQLAADTDDWNPTSLSTATLIRLDTDANLRYLSSIAAQAGRRLRLANISANTLILKDKIAALGTAANRIDCSGQDLPLFPGDVFDLYYDDTSACWRVVAPLAKVIPSVRFGEYYCVQYFSTANAPVNHFNLFSNVSGTGAALSLGAADSNIQSTYLSYSTGTDTTGRAGVTSNSGTRCLLGNGWYRRLTMRIRIPVASDGTDTYTVHAGYNDNSTGGDATDGAEFRYIHSANSGNWVGVLRSNGAETAVNCNAGPPFSSTTPFSLSVVITPTRAEWYQNGVLIGSTTTMTNLPTGAGRQTDFSIAMKKSAGTTARIHDIIKLEQVGYMAVPA